MRIPSLFVLELNGALIPAGALYHFDCQALVFGRTPGDGLQLHAYAANLSLADTSKYTAMVELVNVSFSAVIGGVYDCSSLPVVDGRNGYQAITIVSVVLCASRECIMHPRLDTMKLQGQLYFSLLSHYRSAAHRECSFHN